MAKRNKETITVLFFVFSSFSFIVDQFKKTKQNSLHIDEIKRKEQAEHHK
mgnify:CR=1 FL=1